MCSASYLPVFVCLLVGLLQGWVSVLAFLIVCFITESSRNVPINRLVNTSSTHIQCAAAEIYLSVVFARKKVKC
jgi:hypothetical protein